MVAASSEYFEFPNNLGGIIISRVGNHLTGMDVGTTFIDAGWNGLITFQVRNVDHHTRLLKVGLEVARLFVFGLSSRVEEAAKHARNESHHGGRSWESVWQDGLSPFTGISVPERVEQVTSAPAADLATPEKDKPGRFSAIVDDWSGYFGFSKNFPIGIKVTALIFFGIKRNFEIVAELLEPSDNVVSYDVEYVLIWRSN